MWFVQAVFWPRTPRDQRVVATRRSATPNSSSACDRLAIRTSAPPTSGQVSPSKDGGSQASPATGVVGCKATRSTSCFAGTGGHDNATEAIGASWAKSNAMGNWKSRIRCLMSSCTTRRKSRLDLACLFRMPRENFRSLSGGFVSADREFGVPAPRCRNTFVHQMPRRRPQYPPPPPNSSTNTTIIRINSMVSLH